MIGVVLLFAACAGAARSTTSSVSSDAHDAVRLPATFEADRVYITPLLPDGRRLRFFSDSGGGVCIRRALVEQLGLATRPLEERGERHSLASLPTFAAPDVLPPFARIFGPVVRDACFEDIDGMLGMAFFADHVFTLDYGRREMWWLPGGFSTPANTPCAALGFPTDALGVHTASYPSIDVEISGESFPMLLDTGATLNLTPAAVELFAGPARRAGSFIVRSVFQRWRLLHPEWPTAPGDVLAGETFDVIEVPSVRIAGQDVGPVLFAERPDSNLHDFMSSMMDRRVDGSLGGSALRYFRVVLDYPNARACFVRGS